MINFREAIVHQVVLRRKGLTKIEVKMDDGPAQALNYDELTGPVEVGDRVIVNTTAVQLGLGTGGSHYVLWNLHRRSFNSTAPGHIMKLRYTPLQMSCFAVEEPGSPHYKEMAECRSLQSMPVVVGSLHSQLAAAAVAIKQSAPDLRIAYVMTDAGALPIAFSDLVDRLKRLDILDATITSGHAFGGDYEAVNVFSALMAAKQIVQADICIVMLGPGIVGTGTTLGFSGIEQGQILNAVASLEGDPIAMVRLQFGDRRARHHGVSHHTLTALAVAACCRSSVVIRNLDEKKRSVVLRQLDQEDISTRHRIVEIDEDITLDALAAHKLAVSTMGRGADQEPDFFRAAGAAGIYAAQRLKEKPHVEGQA